MLQSVLGPSATQSIKQDAADETAGQVECLDGSFQYRLIWRPHVAEGPSQSGCLVVGFITDIKVPYPMFWMNVLPFHRYRVDCPGWSWEIMVELNSPNGKLQKFVHFYSR